jgi:hypothetical protein
MTDSKTNTNSKNTTQATGSTKPKAWWHYGHAWLVFGGPAAVVIACIVTVYIAVKQQDPVVDEDYYRKGIEINRTLPQAGSSPETNADSGSEAPANITAGSIEQQNALEPAMRARNHAATGVNQKPEDQ